MGLGLVTHVPIQVLPLNYQCCTDTKYIVLWGGGEGRESVNVGGGGGGWRRSNAEGQMGETEGRKRGNSWKNEEIV